MMVCITHTCVGALQAGQKRVESKLDEILGKQNQMQAVADQAAKVLQSISDLSQRQLEAQQALEKAVQSQLYAIKVAAQQNIISLAQALELWKRARRDRATATKAAKLANIPCSSQPTQNNLFTIDRHLNDSSG
jgi:phage host-nuclease inhibitor protein Gam